MSQTSSASSFSNISEFDDNCSLPDSGNNSNSSIVDECEQQQQETIATTEAMVDSVPAPAMENDPTADDEPNPCLLQDRVASLELQTVEIKQKLESLITAGSVGNNWRQLVKGTAEELGNQLGSGVAMVRNLFWQLVWDLVLLVVLLLILSITLKAWNNVSNQKQSLLLNGTNDGLNLTASEPINMTTVEPVPTTKNSKPAEEYCLANIGNGSWNPQGASESAVFVDLVGLTAVSLLEGRNNPINIRTREPFSMLDAVLQGRQCQPIFYFELLIQKNIQFIVLGLSSPDVDLTTGEYYWLDKKAESFSISSFGNYWQSGNGQEGYADVFVEGDVMGCGLLMLVKDHQLRQQLFFTNNGHIYGKPIWLPKEVIYNLLYPTIGLYGKGTAVEANFGANLLMKPFRYKLEKHEIVEQ